MIRKSLIAEAEEALFDFAKRQNQKDATESQNVHVTKAERTEEGAAFESQLIKQREQQRTPPLVKYERRLLITYSWPGGQSDLDSRTDFLSGQVGWNYPTTAPYLEWSGDNTGTGPETVEVLVQQALDDVAWSGSVFVYCHADWYTPAGGTGDATLTAKNEDSGLELSITISPGQQDEGATSLVGTIEFFEDGSFTLT